MSNLLSCPTCGETRLWSVESASIAYPATFDKDGPDYTGEEYQVYDEGTKFSEDIQCPECGRGEMTLEDLVPADSWAKR